MSNEITINADVFISTDALGEIDMGIFANTGDACVRLGSRCTLFIDGGKEGLEQFCLAVQAAYARRKAEITAEDALETELAAI